MRNYEVREIEYKKKYIVLALIVELSEVFKNRGYEILALQCICAPLKSQISSYDNLFPLGFCEEGRGEWAEGYEVERFMLQG